MKFMRYAMVLVLCLLVACAGSLALADALPEEILLHFFYETPEDVRAFEALIPEKLGEDAARYPYSVQAFSVSDAEGKAKYEALTDQFGISREGLAFPLMIVNCKTFSGMETIGKNLLEAFLTAGEDIFVNGYVWLPSMDVPLFDQITVDPSHATLVYFYRITCPECGKTKPVIDELPAQITVDGKTIPLDIIRINTRSGNNGSRVRAFFAAYGVPEEKQMVPIVFLREGYLSGYDEISASLAQMLSEGAALNFALPEAPVETK